eukprot:9046464-Pyramimonas_sp.AAC.1
MRTRSGKTGATPTNGVDNKKPTVASSSKPSTSSPNYVGYLYMLLLAVQYGFQPFLTSTFTPPSVQGCMRRCVPIIVGPETSSCCLQILIVFGQELAKAMYSIPVLYLGGKLGSFFDRSRIFEVPQNSQLDVGV